MSHTLIFIEHKDDIKFFEKYFQRDAIIISMDPSVGIELSKKGIPYKNTLNFFGVKGHKKTLILSKNILEISRPLFNNLGVNKLNYSIEQTLVYYFRMYIYYIVSSIFIVNLVTQKYKVEKIITLSTKKPSKLNVKIDGSDRILGELISQYCKSHRIKFYHIKAYGKDSKFNKIQIIIKDIIRYMIFNMMIFLYTIINKKKSAILAPETSYNMPRLLDEVSQQIPNALPVYLNVGSKNTYKYILELIKGKSFFFSFYTPYKFSRKRKAIIRKISDSFSINKLLVNIAKF